MRVANLQSTTIGDERELRADVTFENPSVETHPVWFRRPDDGALHAPGDPYLAALLVSALALHEDLHIDAPVSAPLLAAARERILPVQLSWFPDFADTSIHCAEVAEPALAAEPRGVGSFFSSGIDSWYSLLQNRDDISHVIFLHGFEIDVRNRELRDLAWKNVLTASALVGKRALPIATNARDVVARQTRRRLKQLGRERRFFWVKCYFGSMLVGVGQSLARSFERVIVPASWSGTHLGPNGSHPSIEPNWSTPALTFELDGLTASRIEKVRAIAAVEPDAFRHLRVCIDVPRRGLNCGRCFKCVRTQMELRAVGISDGVAPFPEPLDLARTKRERFPADPNFWSDVAVQAELAGDRELAEAVRVVLGRRFHWPRVVHGWRMLASREGRRHLKRVRDYARAQHEHP